MLTYLKNLLRKKTSASPNAAPTAVAARPASEIAVPLPRVETASLQLLAIMAKFPDDLRQFVVKLPPPEAMVSLPLPTILKFLPSGSVKMSLASVVRQAPPGTFAAMPTIEKRGVEVPLAEIFKRVSPAILKKRDDQRYTDLAEDGFDIFGDEENPFALAPRVSDPPPPPPPSKYNPSPSSIKRPQRSSIQMPDASAVTAPPFEMPAPAPSSRMTPAIKLSPDSPVAPLSPPAPVTAEEPPPIVDDQPPLVLPLQDLVANWPEPIKSEASALNGTTVALPAGELSRGLSKGKVAFHWGQIRAWLTPAPTAPTEGDETTELSLPLRIIAPAFLKHSKKVEQPKKKLSIDSTIPELFAGGRELAPAAQQPAPPLEVPVPVAETQPAELPAVPTLKISAEAPPTPKPAVSFAEPPAVSFAEPAREEAPAPIVENFAFAPDVAETPAPVAASKPLPQTLSELFGEPGRSNWSPSDLIAAMLATLPTVDGAIVALQEGLVVAHHLPEGFKGDVFAAFLPQMFARINQYSGEMKLGSVNDLVLNADGRQCQLFRIGQIFFGVLAKPNEALPWHELRLCANSLAE